LRFDTEVSKQIEVKVLELESSHEFDTVMELIRDFLLEIKNLKLESQEDFDALFELVDQKISQKKDRFAIDDTSESDKH
jgi:hypothetical protein